MTTTHLPPCMQPMQPAEKKLFACLLLAAVVAVATANLWQPATPAPPVCRTETQC